MNDGSFASLMAIKAGLTNEEAQSFIEGLTAVLKNEIREKGKAEIEGLGIFEVKDDALIFEASKELLEPIK